VLYENKKLIGAGSCFHSADREANALAKYKQATDVMCALCYHITRVLFLNSVVTVMAYALPKGLLLENQLWKIPL
jgi:hypothetical protein